VTPYSAQQLAEDRARMDAEETELRGALAFQEGIVDYQVTLSPHLERRGDLQKIADVYEAAERAANGKGKPVLGLITTGAQVGKTMMIQTAKAWHLRRNPSHFLGYGTYQSRLAEQKSEGIRDLAKKAGVDLRQGSNAKGLWTTPEGGGLLATGISSGWTGQAGLVEITWDDPYADMLAAMSVAENANITSRIGSGALTRLHPRTSFILDHTRWTNDDAIAQMRALIEKMPVLRERFDVHDVALSVVDEFTGEALITYGNRDRLFWETQRALVGELVWWPVYMCKPRDMHSALFDRRGIVRGPRPKRYRAIIGTDMAYSEETKSDWSVAVVLLMDLDNYIEVWASDVPGGVMSLRKFPIFYIDDVIAKQCPIEQWAEELKALKRQYQCAIKTRTGGQEKGIVNLFSVLGLHVEAEPARTDKYSAAQHTATSWARGAIVWPEEFRPWMEQMILVVCGFTGKSNAKDDHVDALVNAHDALYSPHVAGMLNSNAPQSSPVRLGAMSRSLGRVM
jgi:predicted phage terminase large subunit-like protein